jgi:hypothetical protein
MHMLKFPHDQPVDKDERKQAGRDAQAHYPRGYRPLTEHPSLFCRAADRPALLDRLDRQPWKEWYETLLRPLAEVALAAKDLPELMTPLFNLKVFPLKGATVRPVQAMGGSWKASVANCALYLRVDWERRPGHRL